MTYFTVIYKDVQPGEEASNLGNHPKVTAMSWSHVMNERDRYQESHAALVSALEAIAGRERHRGQVTLDIEELLMIDAALKLAKGE